MKNELKMHRTFNGITLLAILFLVLNSFTNKTNDLSPKRFSTIDVERINIVEPDGTVKMIITNVDQFPTGNGTKINGIQTNPKRKQRAGMLFFNEDGIECGGLIYDGMKKGNEHRSGLSLTYDQYNGDQVMQLLNKDYKDGAGNRRVSTSLMFNDRSSDEAISEGKVGRGVPRVMLGKTRSQNNGLFLFDDTGKPKAMFYIDKDNKPRLETYNDKMEVEHSWPEKK